MGKGVLKAVENVNKLIAPAITGKDETTQSALDKVDKSSFKYKEENKVGR